MPTFSLTDDLGNQVDNVKVNWTSASSLFKYLRSQVLHLIVVPDFLARQDQPLTQAASNPIQFQLKVGNTFQLGNTRPEIDLTPGFRATLLANAAKGSDLFDGDPFRIPATVPEDTGYVGLSLTGSLDLGVSGSSGDLTFGFAENSSITIDYYKAFATNSKEPTLGDAVGGMFSAHVIPGDVADLQQLQVGDICAVSGQGSLTLSGSFSLSTPANPLASVNLPLNVGTISVQDGVMAGVSASLSVAGSYQIRVRRLSSGALELSYLKDKGTTLQTDLSASAGVSVTFRGTELLEKLLGAISKDAVDQNLLAGLSPDEVQTFTAAVKQGVDHSLRASLDLALSKTTDDKAVFQYELHPELFDAVASAAVHRALEGDLSQLTALEDGMQADGTLAPGIKLLNSVLTDMRSQGVTLKVNLLGIVNLISLSQLISNCEILTEPASGDVIIKETAQSERISAITNQLDRQEVLRKAMFESVLATTTYRASKSISMPELACQNMHFAVNTNTNAQTIADYLGWFVALDLLAQSEKSGIVSQFGGGGPSTCLMRTALDDAASESLFFDSNGSLRPESDYVEIGRQALRALLDPGSSEIDAFRFRFLDNENTWKQALDIGASPQLRTLLPLQSTDPRFTTVLSDVIGDLYDIKWWARSMVKAGAALQDMRTFLADRDPIALKDDHEFAQRRDKLQKLMLGVVKESKARFHEPWGMVCLFWASGSRQSSGKMVAGQLVVERNRSAQLTRGAGQPG